MMKKHGRLWSLALAGALTVGNLTGVISPITALAAQDVATGNVQKGDIVTFKPGNVGTFDSKFVTSIKLIADDVTARPGEQKLEDDLPNATDAFGDTYSVPAHYEFAWNDGVKDILLSDAQHQYNDIESESNITLTATLVGDEIAVETNVNSDQTTFAKRYGEQYFTEKNGQTYGKQYSKIADPKVDYFTFKGWDLDNNDTTIEIAPNLSGAQQSEIIEANASNNEVTMTAVLTPIAYTVEYNVDGITTGVKPANSPWKGGDPDVTLADATSSEFTKTGYKLVEDHEWIDSNGKTYEEGSATVANVVKGISGTKATLYLNWEEETTSRTVTLNMNGYTGITIANQGKPWSSGSATTTTGKITLPTVVENVIASKNQIAFDGLPEGAKFLGWDKDAKTATHTPTVVYTEGQEIELKDAITPLYAVFEIPASTKNVKFASGAGTGTMSDMTATDGKDFVLPESAFIAPAKMHFVDWEYTASGAQSATHKEAGKTVEYSTIDDNTTFTATYAYDAFTIEYYTGTSLYKKVNSTAGSGTTLTALPANAIGWDTNSSATYPAYSVDTKESEVFTSAGATVKLYAIVVEDKAEVSYDVSNGTSATVKTASGKTAASEYVAKNKTFKLASASSATEELVGWTTRKYATEEQAKKAGATIYAAGASYSVGGDTTLYAIFKTAASKLKLDGNGADNATTGKMADLSTYEDTFTLPANTYVRAGYTFLGWNTTDGASDKKYDDKANNVPNNTGKLFAIWKPNIYYAAFNKNDPTAKGTMLNVTITDPEAPIAAEQFTDPTDATGGIAGWALTEGATEAEFKTTDSYAKVIKAANLEAGDTVVLYAVWNFPESTQKAKEAQAEAEKEAEAAKEAEATAKEDAANQKAEADQAKAAKEATDKELAAAKEELSKVSKAQNNVDAETGEKVDTKVDGSAVITSIPATAIKNGKYEVPSTIKVNGADYTVTKIEAKALKNNKQIKQITVPATVTEIGTQAFQGAKNLKKITIKGKDVVIRKNAFKKINKKAKIFVADKDTKTNVTSKGGAPKTVKVKVKK